MIRRGMMLPVALLLLGACAKSEQPESAMVDSSAAMNAAPVAAAADPAVGKAVAVYRGVEANPAAAESVLTANGLTQAGLDSLMFEIAADSARSAAYTAAIR